MKTKIEFLNLKKHLDGKPCVNLAIVGNDDYLVESAVAQIRESIKLEYAELNYAVMSEDVVAAKIIDSCTAMPFMSPRRMVVVKDYSPKAESEKIRLRDYFFDPNEQTCLVMCFKDKDAANEFDIDVVNCDKLDTAVLAKWITSKVAKNGKTVSASNAEKIAEYCLNNMGRINRETEKLCVYSENEITAEAVELLVEKESEYIVWELAQEIAKKNADGAFAAALGLLDKGEDVVSLIASIYALFRRMFYTAVSSAGLKELSAMLDVKEYAVKKAREAAENFTQVQLKNALKLIKNADEEIKTFNSDKLTVFHGLILGLLNSQ